MDWSDIVVGGVAIAPLIVALIELLKGFGLPVKFAPALCGVLAVGAYVVSAVVIPAYPEVAVYAQWIVGALLVFLTATGAYQIVKPNKN